MRVQHFPRRFVASDWGGAESAVLEIAKALMARGHQSEILTSAALSHSGMDAIDGVPVQRFAHFYPYLGLGADARDQLDQRGGNLFSVSLLWHLMTSRPPDVFHLHTGKRMGGIVRMAARHHRRPYVVSLRGGVLDVPQDECRRWNRPTNGSLEWGRVLGAAVGERRVLDDAAAILCVDRNEQAMLQKQYPDKRIVWNPSCIRVENYLQGDGRAFREQLGIPAGSRMVLCVGRIDPQKNQLEAVKVVERLSAHISIHLVLVGPESDRAYAEKLRHRISLSPCARNIHLAGPLAAGSPELINAYHAADCFLLSSVHEFFGIVLLEAWAAGVPVVAARVGGVPSFVDQGKNGLLYEPGDIGQAASYVEAFLRSRDLVECFQGAARQKVRCFDAGHTVDSLLALYEEVKGEYALCA
ncbi:MAG: glycosyltransferase family 4 protein [Acidobacteriia bacterium]|nr:glycosyltransferase family 4 protein [Terriglobia bacterium]